jgi:NAD(P)-dependent dehydrogenase (short-subunit alcohol dehydrogenase family)
MKGRIALVTGASRGIGRAIVLSLGRLEAEVGVMLACNGCVTGKTIGIKGCRCLD